MSGRKSMQGKTSPISFEVFKEKLSQLKGIERPVDSMTMTRSYRSSIDDLLSSKLITEVLLTPSATTLDHSFLDRSWKNRYHHTSKCLNWSTMMGPLIHWTIWEDTRHI